MIKFAGEKKIPEFIRILTDKFFENGIPAEQLDFMVQELTLQREKIDELEMENAKLTKVLTKALKK